MCEESIEYFYVFHVLGHPLSCLILQCAHIFLNLACTIDMPAGTLLAACYHDCRWSLASLIHFRNIYLYNERNFFLALTETKLVYGSKNAN